MDMDVFGNIDDLLDFSNDQLLVHSTSTATTTDSATNHHRHFSYLDNYPTTTATTFTDHLCIPDDDIAELEWLSNFVDDSFTEFPSSSISGTMNVHSSHDTSFNSDIKDVTSSRSNRKRSFSPSEMLPRKCTHCSSEKTPQWRTGPLGPKTLCNACGVRYKSGRLVPEYRPAASPTFVLTQHSNSHRKVMELRRQKEMYRPKQTTTADAGMLTSSYDTF